MKVRALFPSLLVIGLLSSMAAPLGAAQEQTVTDAKTSLEHLEDQYRKGLITLQELKEAASGHSQESPGGVLLAPVPEDVFLEEDFETWPPAGWTIENNGGACVWERSSFTGRPNYAGGDGQCADADSDQCGSSSTMDTTMISPPVGLSDAPPGIFLEFVGAYNDIGVGDIAQVYVSPDGGLTWYLELQWDEDHSAYGPGEVVHIDLTPYVGNTAVVIAFRYVTTLWAWWFEVDQVRVLAPRPDLGESSKEVFPAKAAPGDILDYTVRIQNTGDATAHEVRMTDVIPDGTAYVPGSLGCSSGTCWHDVVADAVYWEGEVYMPLAPLEGRRPDPSPVSVPMNPDCLTDNVPVEGLPLDIGAPSAGAPAYRTDSAIYDNGPLVTHPGECSGVDASRVQGDLGMSTLGSGHQYSNGNRMADGFGVPDPGGWQIDTITFFAYQVSAPDSPSPIAGVYYQIWDGPPDDAGSSVVFGDLTTNRLLSSVWAGMYRDSDTSPCAADRAVFPNVAAVGTVLPPGTYWLDWTTDGDSYYSGPWAPPTTVSGETATGDALQYTTSWIPAVDAGTGTQQGMPFVIQGSVLPTEIEITFQVEVGDRPCGASVVNTALIEDPAALPVVVEASAEVWSTTLLHEDFEGVFPPAGWAVTDHAGTGEPGSVWNTDNPGGLSNPTGGSGPFAIVDDYLAGDGAAVETDMQLPPIDIPACYDTYLVFKTEYNNNSPSETAAVDISLDGGVTWDNLLTWNNRVLGPHTERVPLGGYAGATGAILRFYYNDGGTWGLWWAVDDVQIVGCVKEGVFLTPGFQEAAGCAGEVLPYALSLENCTGETETFDLYATGEYWPTWVEPAEVEVPSGGIVAVDAYVQEPCGAVGSDLVTIFAQSGSHTDSAEILSVASRGSAGEEWEVMAALPEGRVLQAVVGTDDHVYVIGGASDAGGGVPTATNFRYDIDSGAWDTVAPMPTALTNINGGLVWDKIYVPGGEGDANTYVYDISLDAWSSIPPSGTFEWAFQYAVAVDGDILYRLGGSVDDGAGFYISTNRVWALDTVSGLWTELPPMQQDRSSFSAGAIGGNLWAAGGVHFPGFAPEMTSEVFGGGVWSYAAAVPDGGGAYDRWSYNADATALGKLWVIGGRRDTAWDVLDHTGFYDPATDSWTTTPYLPLLNQGRVYLQGAAAGGYLFAIGGRDSMGSTIYDVNERLSVIPCDPVEANVEVKAPQLEVALRPGHTASMDLEICSSGTCPLEFEIEATTPWLGASAESGVLPTGWCETITLTFDATGMITGHYMATLEITNNDPDRPVVSLPAHLTVTGMYYLPLVFKCE